MSYSHPIASLPVHNSHHVNFKFRPEAAITEEKTRNKNNGPSPHQLDELAATATIFLNQSNNNNSRSIMHKVQLDEKKDGGSSTDNVQMPEDSSSSVHVPSLSNSTNTSTVEPAVETATVEPTVKTTTQRQRAPTITSTTDGYHDYAQEEDPTEKLNRDYAGHSSLIAHEDETTRSLANQKLPAKLAAMLSDPDLISCITWLPHGRSWKILNRDLFSSYALPRYFGHTNHSSFVRVVNAWGFRRIVSGPDRDSYYHELFLRGKVGLYSRMKRLPNNSGGSSGRKRGGKEQGSSSPQLKGVEEKPLDFYEMSKQSPLPENTWQYRPQAMNNGGVGSRSSLGAAAAAFGGAGMPGGMQMGGMMSSMVPPPPTAGMVGMGMHHPSQFSTGGAVGYPTMASAAAPMPMMSAAATTAPMPMMASSGWNVPTQMQVGGPSSASTSATAAAGMMGMSRHRQPSISMPFDGSSSAASSAAGGRGGPPADNNSSSSIGSSTNSNRPQLLAAAAAALQRPNESSSSAMTASTGAPTSISNSSSEIQSLMNQNQLLQALLRKSQAAVAAANVAPGGGTAAGGSTGGYPYPYSGPPAYGHGGNDEMKRQG